MSGIETAPAAVGAIPHQPPAPDGRALGADALQRALRAGRLVPYFQPIVALPSRRVVSFEALARLRGDDGVILPPGRFIPTAEESGLVVELGSLMLDAAVAAAVEWRRSRSLATASVAVNVAPAQLEGGGFPGTVRDALAAHGLPPAGLTVEITETTAMSPAALPALEELAGMGVRIALDDFGMGFANLDQLRRVPVGLLKIDRSFVAKVTDRGPDQAIIRMIIDLAEALDLSLVAEGVETDAQADVLHRLGCHNAQGFLFSRPLADARDAARAVTPPATAATTVEAAAAWSPEVEAALLAAARLLARDEDRHRATVHAVMSTGARGMDLPAAAAHAATRIGLVHDVARLCLDDRVPPALATVPLLAALASGAPVADPDDARLLDMLTAVTGIVDAAAATDPALSGRTLALAFSRAAARTGVPAELGPALAEMATSVPEIVPIGEILDDLQVRRVGRRGMEERLLGLIGVSRVAATADDSRHLLRLALEETRRIAGAASASLSRWDRAGDRVAVLVNVGELGPGESEFPADGTRTAPAPQALLQGTTVVTTVAEGTDQSEVELLQRLNRSSSARVPILVDGRLWGGAWLATAVGEPEFSENDVPLLDAVAVQLSAVVAQAEALDRMARLAFEDPLTGRGNRRALDDRLGDLRALGSAVTACIVDIDGLKHVNDTLGHEHGDRVLREVAAALVAAVADLRGADVFHLGGDEFCVLVPGGDPARIAELVAGTGEAVRSATGTGFSFGVTTGAAGWTPRDLLLGADAALERVKRSAAAG